MTLPLPVASLGDKREAQKIRLILKYFYLLFIYLINNNNIFWFVIKIKIKTLDFQIQHVPAYYESLPKVQDYQDAI